MIKLIFSISIFFAIIDQSLSHNISCFHSQKFFETVNSYYCNVADEFSITSFEDVKITSTNSTESELQQANGIRFFEKTCHYFPKNLESVFIKSLVVIEISYGHLKEIHRTDLKPFGDLLVLYLEQNDIEILEDGIFDNNTKLKSISLERNRIKHIGLNVFDTLTHLTRLNLLKNECINIISDTKNGITNIKNKLNSTCKNAEYVELYEAITQLEEIRNKLSFDDFQEYYDNLTIVENILMSKFLGSSLAIRIHVLKDWSFEILWKNSGRKFQIIGGEETTIKQFPHQCAFLANKRLRCGCSVISNNCFLTAGHCTYQYNTNITVRVGSTFKELGGEVYDIKRIVNYPSFDILKLNYDYAILIPDREIQFDYVNVRPVSLPEQNQLIPENTTCTVSGWGKADNDTRPDKLRFVDVKVVNQATCQACYNTSKVRFKITDYMMCAGYMEGGRDACSGDSGGPLICPSDNKIVQAGVVSSGYGCAIQNFPGIYADVGKVRSWIKDYCNII